MAGETEGINMKSCRICLSTNKPLCPLFKYKLSGNYAEMLTAIADVKVAANDGLPDKICSKCCTSLEKAFLLKTVAEKSYRKLRAINIKKHESMPTKKITFDSFTDVKKEIELNVKPEPKWEMEIEVLGNDTVAISNPIDSMQGTDILIANTVIRKVEANDGAKNDFFDDKAEIEWKPNIKDPIKKDDESDVEFLDDFFQDDDDDDDYIPLQEVKSKFKKPKLPTKVLKKTEFARKIKIINKVKMNQGIKIADEKPKGGMITCYPIMKNGSKGPPIMLKRPKDATVLKVGSNYKSKNVPGTKVLIRDRQRPPVKIVSRSKPVVVKPREKLVCPVCGILTFTLGNHMSTHQEKKRYTCSQCPKTFAQKGNLLVHQKQHSGIKDHICEICGAGFYCQKSLLRHNLIHKGERPFGCSLCPKRFIARCDLNRHMRIHSGYKPYKCSTCTMSFNAKHQLQNHERMHTGERPYTCQICNVAFSYKVNLNNHVLKTHGINLKFKSIHTVTEEILRREMEMAGEARMAIAHIMPQLGDVPTPAAHETVHDY